MNNSKQVMNQYGAGSGQSVFTHVGQNAIMNNNKTAFSLNNGANLEKRTSAEGVLQ